MFYEIGFIRTAIYKLLTSKFITYNGIIIYLDSGDRYSDLTVCLFVNYMSNYLLIINNNVLLIFEILNETTHQFTCTYSTVNGYNNYINIVTVYAVINNESENN